MVSSWIAWLLLLLRAARLPGTIPLSPQSTSAPLRISHAGLYANLPSHPLRPYAAYPGDAVPPALLTLYIDAEAYSIDSAALRVHTPRTRSWEDVTYECGVGGIENCERSDLGDSSASASAAQCQPTRVSAAEDRILYDLAPCTSALTPSREVALLSTVVEVKLRKASGEEEEVQRFWLGHLRHAHDAQRARWPLDGAGSEEEPNRIAGLMEDPYLPRAAQTEPGDPDNGLYMDAAYWNLGLSIRVPTAILSSSSAPAAPRRKLRFQAASYDDDDDEADTLAAAHLLPVHSPVGGQVVYVRPYVLPQAPITGLHAGDNDEVGTVLMVRDEWGFVWQLFGISPDTIRVFEGQSVARGDVLGEVSRRPLSGTPPSRARPADLPKTATGRLSRYYPYRYRELRISVARPPIEWDKWKGPYEYGWQFFNPLHLLTHASYRSKIPPYADPMTLFFAPAPPSTPVGLSPFYIPHAPFSTDDLFSPVLSGTVEIFVGFQSFAETPGDAADGLDGLGLYALDWSVRPADRGEWRGPTCPDASQWTAEWKPAFEHSKFPNGWTVPVPSSSSAPTARPHPINTNMRSLVLPSFTSGSFWSRITHVSQRDAKGRSLLYAPTRTLRGAPHVGPHGGWDTRAVPDGRWSVLVRARDYWGNTGCVGGTVVVRNP